MGQNKTVIKSLTGLRIVLAWVVFFAHMIKPDRISTVPLRLMYENIYIFVDGFFILTGMLLIYNYYDPEKKISVKKYFLGRFARIYPIFFLFTLAILVSAFVKGINSFNPEGIKTIVYNLTMIKSFWYKYVYTGVPQGWTLTVDLILYAIFPFVVYAMRKHLLLGLLVIVPFLLLDPLLTGYAASRSNPEGFMFRYLFIFLIDLYIGMLFSFLMLRQRKIQSNYLFTGIGLFFTFIFLRYKTPIVIALQPSFPLWLYVEIIFVAGFCLGPLFYGLATEKNALSRLLSTKLFLVLGSSSYVFYLAHLGFVRNSFERYVSDNIVIIFLFLTVFSILGNKYVEDPARKYILKKLGKNRG
ncbi:acyltransferase family protein [Polluticaenibacter yanchengensis]|uniref:Acyltransferase n=1 Tax=Polluticaenibacter yanchengensis TaxID=3014562 RepID=A0ABT4UJY3_9BACT|nr:acyltransferase [Chitinophagaceae bacterium LY-5]